MKKLRWIIQENDISDQDIVGLTDALDDQGVEWVLIKQIPFDPNLPEFPVDDEHENIYYGGTSFISNVQREHNPLGVFYDPETFSMRNYIDKLGSAMFNAQGESLTIKEALEKDFGSKANIFIRPDGDGKEFNGQVVTPEKAKAVLKGALLNDEKIDENFPILIAPAYNILCEWRVYMVNGVAVTASQYQRHHRLSKKASAPIEVLEYAQEQAERYSPHDVFALDVCECLEDDEPMYFVLECGCMNSVGFYLSDKRKYTEAINEYIKSKLDD